MKDQDSLSMKGEISEGLHTPTARRLAAERASFMHAFLAQLWKKHDAAHPMEAAPGGVPSAAPAAPTAPAAREEAEEDEKSPEEKNAEGKP